MTELNRRTSMFNRAAPGHPDLAVDAVAQARLVDLTIDGVQPDPGNPRRHFDQAKLEELALSFSASGIIQPIVVRPGEGGIHIRSMSWANNGSETATRLSTFSPAIRNLPELPFENSPARNCSWVQGSLTEVGHRSLRRRKSRVVRRAARASARRHSFAPIPRQ